MKVSIQHNLKIHIQKYMRDHLIKTMKLDTQDSLLKYGKKHTKDSLQHNINLIG